MGSKTKKRSKPFRHLPRVAVQRVQSLFVHWTPGCFRQVLLASLGLMVLGMALWIVLFDRPPAADDWPGWKFRDVALVFLAWLSLAGLEQLGWTVAQHEIHARTGRPVRALLGNFVLLGGNQLAILIAVDVFGLRAHGLNWHQFGLRPISPGWLWASVGMGVGLIVLGVLVALVVERWLKRAIPAAQATFILPDDEGPPPSSAPAAAAGTGPPAAPPRSLLMGAVGMVILAGVATPFCEEILFRGVLFDWLADRLWVPLAVVLSATAFGLAHLRFGLPVAIVTGACGIVLAVAYYLGDTLWAPIIIHTVFNAPKILLLYALRARGIRLPAG
jgi:membrane protease YdiL (CAAX protease family)